MEHLDFLALDAWGVGFRTALERHQTLAMGRKAGIAKESIRGPSQTVDVYLPDSLVKDALEVSLRKSRTLYVLVDDLVRLVDLLDVVQDILVFDRLHVLLGQISPGGRVISKIDLGADQDDWGSRGVVGDLGKPLAMVRYFGSSHGQT